MWYAKIMVVTKHPNKEETLDTIMLLINSNLKELYKNALSIIKTKKCGFVAIYDNCDIQSCLQDDATTSKTISKYHIYKGIKKWSNNIIMLNVDKVSKR